MKSISHSDLLSILSFNQTTGVFVRLNTVGRCGRWRAGEQVGHTSKIGYIQIHINGKSYLAHRLAWFYVYGVWPKNILDHINGIKSDNRIENLRECNHALNMQNIRTSHKDNSTSLLGVKKLPGGRFQARIYVNKKELNLGVFDTAQEAHRVYLSAKRQLHEFCTVWIWK